LTEPAIRCGVTDGSHACTVRARATCRALQAVLGIGRVWRDSRGWPASLTADMW